MTLTDMTYPGKLPVRQTGNFGNKYPHCTNLFGWWKYFCKAGSSEIKLPCSNMSIVPAVAARLAGCKVVIKVQAHHELSRVSTVVLMQANKIIPGSLTLYNALKSKRLTSGKVTEFSCSIEDISQLKLSLSSSSNKSILALSGESDIKGLFDIFRICAIVFKTVPDLKLGVFVYSKRAKSLIESWQLQYDTPNMCFFIDNSVDSLNNDYSFLGAISGPGLIDCPVFFELVRKTKMALIADGRSKLDFPDCTDCVWIDGIKIRQYATALQKILK